MKACEEFAPLLSAYFDGELTESESAEVRSHLCVCPACRARLDELIALHGALGALEEAEVPEGFTANVMAAVRAEKAAQTPRTKKQSAWRRWMSMAACAAIIALAAVTLPQMGVEQTGNDAAAPAAAENQALFSMSAPTEAPNEAADVEYPEHRCETVQSSSYADALGGAEETAGSSKAQTVMKSAEDGSPVCFCEVREIDGEEGLLWVRPYGAVVLELFGENATAYVEENGGVKADDAGFYYLPVSALLALPEDIALTDAQAAELACVPAEAEWVLVCPDDLSEVPQP